MLSSATPDIETPPRLTVMVGGALAAGAGARPAAAAAASAGDMTCGRAGETAGAKS